MKGEEKMIRIKLIHIYNSTIIAMTQGIIFRLLNTCKEVLGNNSILCIVGQYIKGLVLC